VENTYQNGGSPIEESFYEDDFEFDETFEESQYENDNLSLPSSEHSRNYPVTCKVIYPYQVMDLFSLTVCFCLVLKYDRSLELFLYFPLIYD